MPESADPHCNRGQELVFEPVCEANLPVVAEIIRAAWTPEAEVHGVSAEQVPQFPAFITVEQFGRYMRDSNVTMHLLTAQGRAVACGGHSPDDECPRTGWINRVAVRPRCQGRGYGTAMVLFLEECLRARGMSRARLGHVTANRRLHGLYERMGWRTFKTAMSRSWALDITFMEKDL